MPELRALIVADGDAPDRDRMTRAWPGWADGIQLVVAADGGALIAEALGVAPELVVGDGDSLGASEIERFRRSGVEVRLAPADKDESDAELAIDACLARGATSITIIGAFGGRLDHALTNIWLLALPRLADRTVELLDESTRVSLIRAGSGDDGAATARGAGADPDEGGNPPVRRALPGRVGDIVSLLPLGGPVFGVSTEGLLYPLSDESLAVGPSRGLSNVRLATTAAVTIRRGMLLVVESPATLTP